MPNNDAVYTIFDVSNVNSFVSISCMHGSSSLMPAPALLGNPRKFAKSIHYAFSPGLGAFGDRESCSSHELLSARASPYGSSLDSAAACDTAIW